MRADEVTIVESIAIIHYASSRHSCNRFGFQLKVHKQTALQYSPGILTFSSIDIDEG